jgi:CheY-like chemotaxis protein
MKDGGTLKVSATNQLLEGKPEGLRGKHVALRVADTGTGMSRETMDRVFEPFFTTKSFGEGTGLGLSQVFGFAKQLGGAVTVESKLGEGATFTLYLPASATSAAAEIAHADEVHARGRVLVVEDDLLVAELAAGMLAELGFEPVVSHSAKEALECLAGGNRPKLVFTDIVMPGGISGIELAEKVRTRFPELPILLTTGYSEEVGGKHGFPVLQKPYELDTLAGAVARILKRELTAN